MWEKAPLKRNGQIIFNGERWSLAAPKTRTSMSSQTCRISELPIDLQSLVLDFIEDSLGECGLKRHESHRFRRYRIPLSSFPRVRMWTDYRSRAYAEAMIGADLPPIVVCGDEWLDGKNRVWASRQGGQTAIDCIDLAEIGVRVRYPGLGKLH